MRIWGLEETHDDVYQSIKKILRDKQDPQVREAIKNKDKEMQYKEGYVTWNNQRKTLAHNCLRLNQPTP